MPPAEDFPRERRLAASTALPSLRRTLSVIVPVRNEAAGLPAFFARLLPVLDSLGLGWEVIAVDDGSEDGSLALLRRFAAQDGRIRVLVLARSFGKDSAVTAGLDFASGDGAVPMDADLQDPPELLPDLVAAWRAGADVVNAVRQARPGDGVVVRWSAQLFYHLMTRALRVRLAADVGDFRLLDRRVLAAVGALREQNRFLKGLVAWPGFRTTAISYVRPGRTHGRSAWSWWRLWNFALDGIIGYSSAPLRIWLYLGLLISGLSFGYGGWLVVRKLLWGADLPGYTSLMAAILFLGGAQLVVLGLMGEYISRMHAETKSRPLYIVGELVGLDATQFSSSFAPPTSPAVS